MIKAYQDHSYILIKGKAQDIDYLPDDMEGEFNYIKDKHIRLSFQTDSKEIMIKYGEVDKGLIEGRLEHELSLIIYKLFTSGQALKYVDKVPIRALDLHYGNSRLNPKDYTPYEMIQGKALTESVKSFLAVCTKFGLEMISEE